LIPVHPAGRKLPFFWIHGDSSNACLSQYLGADRPLYALEHQAHDGRRALYTRVDTIARHYLDELRSIRPHGPYVLGGYSFGAAVAFEAAQQLTTEGEEVAMLFMLDPPSRQATPGASALDRSKHYLRSVACREKLNSLLPRLKRVVRGEVTARMDRIDKSLERLHWQAYLLQGRHLPPSLRSAYILDVYRRALRSYAPQKYSGPVTIFKGKEICYQPPLDWLDLFSGELEIHEAPCGHLDLTKEPHVAVWAARLRDSLDRCDHQN
jgi:aspartate racemase